MDEFGVSQSQMRALQHGSTVQCVRIECTIVTRQLVRNGFAQIALLATVCAQMRRARISLRGFVFFVRSECGKQMRGKRSSGGEWVVVCLHIRFRTLQRRGVRVPVGAQARPPDCTGDHPFGVRGLRPNRPNTECVECIRQFSARGIRPIRTQFYAR